MACTFPVDIGTVAQDTKRCGLAICPSALRVYVYLFFLSLLPVNSALPITAPEKDKIVHSYRGSLGFSHFFYTVCRRKRAAKTTKWLTVTGAGSSFPSRYFRNYRWGQGRIGN